MPSRRVFTLEEARALVPALRPRLREMARLRELLLPFREKMRGLNEGALRGGGTVPGAGEYLRHIQALNRHLEFLRGNGVALKDLASGLVDFPSLRAFASRSEVLPRREGFGPRRRGGRLVYLCWRMEEETVAHWHEIKAGFAGRKPVESPLPEPPES